MGPGEEDGQTKRMPIREVLEVGGARRMLRYGDFRNGHNQGESNVWGIGKLEEPEGCPGMGNEEVTGLGKQRAGSKRRPRCGEKNKEEQEAPRVGKEVGGVSKVPRY